jgi:hypothetical protein
VNLSAGIKGGVNFSDIATDPVDEACCERKTGLTAGLFVDIPFTATFGLQPEFLFSQKGATFGEVVDVEVDYFEVPVLLRADFSSAPTRPFVLFGPTLGFLTKARQTIGGVEEDIKDDLESFDLGFAVAGGIQFGRGSIEARYTHGLSDPDKDPDFKARNRVASILAGFRF